MGGANNNNPAILAWSGGLQYYPNGGGVYAPPNVPRTSSDWQHVVMLVDSTASMSDGYRVYINGSYWGKAPLKDPADPFPNGAWTVGNFAPNGGNGGPFKGLIDEVAIYDLNADADLAVAGQRIADHYSRTTPTEWTEFTLSVDISTGAASLKNTTAFSIDLTGYSIASSAGSLNAVGWNSLQDQDFEGHGLPGSGNGWEEGGGSNPNMLIETYLLGSSIIGRGQVISLGTLFSPGASQDIAFLYATQDNVTHSGIVEYVAPEPSSLGLLCSLAVVGLSCSVCARTKLQGDRKMKRLTREAGRNGLSNEIRKSGVGELYGY